MKKGMPIGIPFFESEAGPRGGVRRIVRTAHKSVGSGTLEPEPVQNPVDDTFPALFRGGSLLAASFTAACFAAVLVSMAETELISVTVTLSTPVFALSLAPE